MKTLRKINIVIAIIGLSAGLYNWFIHGIDLSFNAITAFLIVMFFLFGMEYVLDKERKSKLGYGYIITSLILFSLLLIDLFRKVI
ncbi:hypothetical protein MUN89_08390 [Halobacillus salinarum]|uniref:DUF3953 domain-containing protein n=1 Tax=Halobacillus salinarum TaxID=2932257 RepID=A0ABY4EN88_9BACI|nr:hypothetical protein [Halobacillus salinarum]UOQ45924.1 hypothetical protein MUN89_08390 [Halobacillus salinarum]